MTEDVTATETVVDASPGNTSPDRALRHKIQRLLNEAGQALAGRVGLTQAEQVERATKALQLTETAMANLGTLAALLANRDFEKFQATRDRSAEAEADGHSGYGGGIGFLVIELDDDDDDDDDDDSDDDPDAELFGQD